MSDSKDTQSFRHTKVQWKTGIFQAISLLGGNWCFLIASCMYFLRQQSQISNPTTLLCSGIFSNWTTTSRSNKAATSTAWNVSDSSMPLVQSTQITPCWWVSDGSPFCSCLGRGFGRFKGAQVNYLGWCYVVRYEFNYLGWCYVVRYKLETAAFSTE